MAIILTLTFRTFLGENYQIPTGSMAPTLQGRHMDVVCPECDYQYRTGASMENEEDGVARGEVTVTTCPICRYRLELDKQHDLNQRSFGGDRIIVSKLAYLFQEPKRWDVFVFKYPGNPKINYIKRLGWIARRDLTYSAWRPVHTRSRHRQPASSPAAFSHRAQTGR